MVCEERARNIEDHESDGVASLAEIPKGKGRPRLLWYVVDVDRRVRRARAACRLKLAVFLCTQLGLAAEGPGSRLRNYRKKTYGGAIQKIRAPPELARRDSLGLVHDAEVRLGCLPAFRELLLRLLVTHRPGNDHVVAQLPVGWCRDPVLRCELR
jgi:hypothetical protein